VYFEADPDRDRYFRSPTGTYQHEFDLGRFIFVKDNGDGTGMFKLDQTLEPGYQASSLLTPVAYRYRWREMRPDRL
jgi:hypothetical protein